MPEKVGTFSRHGSGRSVAWLARLFRVQEVVSSNLTAPTILPLRYNRAEVEARPKRQQTAPVPLTQF